MHVILMFVLLLKEMLANDANEVELSILLKIRNYLRKWFGQNEDVDAYQKAMNRIEQCNGSGFGTDLTATYMQHILKKYYDTFVSPVIK